MVLVITGLFLAAGTWHLRMLNAFIVALGSSLLMMMLAIEPQITQDSGHADDQTEDTRARLALVSLFLFTMCLAAVDAGRLHFSNKVPAAVSVVALILFVAASAFQAWAMAVNSFYSPVIHIQAEREHNVVTRGPYRVLRHPAYFANIVAVPASALAIGSWVALIPAAACFVLTVWRARREDEFLKKNLAGYREYVERVPGGVFPRMSLRARSLP
jgi:protein-S-isoprenylcysteine O-methyltransferase Ste14